MVARRFGCKSCNKKSSLKEPLKFFKAIRIGWSGVRELGGIAINYVLSVINGVVLKIQ